MEIKRLPVTFSKYGYTLELVQRGQNKAIYSQSIGTRQIAYEILKIRVHPAHYNDFCRRNEPEAEIYPSSEQWGRMGWTCITWERALERYDSLKLRYESDKE